MLIEFWIVCRGSSLIKSCGRVKRHRSRLQAKVWFCLTHVSLSPCSCLSWIYSTLTEFHLLWRCHSRFNLFAIRTNFVSFVRKFAIRNDCIYLGLVTLNLFQGLYNIFIEIPRLRYRIFTARSEWRTQTVIQRECNDRRIPLNMQNRWFMDCYSSNIVWASQWQFL